MISVSWDINIRDRNTFGLNCKTHCLIRLGSEIDAREFFGGITPYPWPILIMGGGSNLLFINDFAGTIIVPEFGDINIEKSEGNSITISAAAGTVWDDLVEWCVQHGYAGLENLSLIPGTVGASPVQNIGAYGAEVRNTIERIQAIDISDGTVKTFSNSECEFGYRDSIFKNSLKGMYMITRVWFRLTSTPRFNLDYGSLHDEVMKLGKPDLRSVRQAVINIRRRKLPDPKEVPNAGSFFRNPVVDREIAGELRKNYPGMPVYEDPWGTIKLSAGWLIEQCGWKGKREGDAGAYEKQALVIVNHGNATGKELLAFSEKILESVRIRFGIRLQREVEVI